MEAAVAGLVAMRASNAVALIWRSDALFALVVGVSVAWILLPHQLLNPLDVSWIPGSGDHAVHYLGWEFFSREPWLQWPITKVWAYGRGLTDSIVFTDSIPLLALLIKPLRCWMQRPINYFGGWLLVSFVLQYYVALLWLRRTGASLVLARMLALLVLLAPPLLYRSTGHTALASHWLVLLPLLLFECATLWWPWAILILLAELIHLYLLAMVLALAAAYAWERRRGLSWRLREPSFLLGLSLFAGSFLLIAMAIGYIPLKPADATASGYGMFRWNLLAPMSAFPSFSLVWPRLPIQPAELEGLSFPGVVPIVMAIMMAAAGWSAWRWRHPTLIAVCILMALFAMTPVIGAGSWQLDLGRLPWPLFILGDIFRASGRFIWPLYYLLLLHLLLAYATWMSRFSRRRRLGFTAILLIVAIVDLRSYRSVSVAPGAPLRMSPPQLAQVLREHAVREITFIPTTEQVSGWEEFAWAALEMGITTNGTYLARYNRGMMESQNLQAMNAITQLRPARQTLYVLTTPLAHSLAASRYPECSLAPRSGGHCVATLAGQHVLLPVNHPSVH